MEDGGIHLYPLDDPVLHAPPLQHRQIMTNLNVCVATQHFATGHCRVYRDIRVAAGAVDLGEVGVQ
eukprot:9990280-Ditylum_brightwellii.AAC.1